MLPQNVEVQWLTNTCIKERSLTELCHPPSAGSEFTATQFLRAKLFILQCFSARTDPVRVAELPAPVLLSLPAKGGESAGASLWNRLLSAQPSRSLLSADKSPEDLEDDGTPCHLPNVLPQCSCDPWNSFVLWE